MKKGNKLIVVLMMAIVMLFVFTGCSSLSSTTSATPPKDMSQQLVDSSKKVAANQATIETAIPIPQMTYSNNRANIAKKLQVFGNDPNKVSWIYCFLPGSSQPVLFTSVKGCVTNLSAYAVPDDQIVKDPYFDYTGGEGKTTKSQGVVIQAPDADGTYGTNGEGIFWFDTAGIYHEWNGYYMLLDQPVKLSVEPLITMNIENK